MDLDAILRLLSDIADGLALPVLASTGIYAVILFRRQLVERREEKYFSLVLRWQEYLQLTLDHLDLGVSEHDEPVRISDDQLTPEQRVKRRVIYEILTSIFEMSYIFFQDKISIFGPQKAGWERYIKYYCDRSDYLEWAERNYGKNFKEGATQYDERFEKFFFEKLRASKARVTESTASES